MNALHEPKVTVLATSLARRVWAPAPTRLRRPLNHSNNLDSGKKIDRVYVAEGSPEMVTRGLQLMMDAEMGGVIPARAVGIVEIDCNRIRFGIDIDGDAVNAVMVPHPGVVAIPNYLDMGGRRYMAVNLGIDGDTFNLPTLLQDNADALQGLKMVFQELGVEGNIGCVIDASGRTQVVLCEDDTATFAVLMDKEGHYVVDFAESDSDITAITATHGGTMVDDTMMTEVCFADLGINLPARRIAVAPDGTKVASFVDFDAGKAYTATFDESWKMVGTPTEDMGYALRLDKGTMTYQNITGGFGTRPWPTPTDMANPGIDGDTPTVTLATGTEPTATGDAPTA